MAAKEFIVAIELGSSKVTGIAGKKELDGSISVYAMVKEESSSFIRKGVIFNIDRTAQCISSIVSKLRAQLKTEINKVYVGISGKSVRCMLNTLATNLPNDTKVTEDMVVDLMEQNRNMNYPDQMILDVALQEYKLGSLLQTDPVGVQCSRLEANFLNILQRKTYYSNINKCFEMAGVKIAEMYLSPLALADSVLSENERRSGCALVDIGADTTTVLVYTKNILRHISVIPLGSNNVTKDIAQLLQIEESDAEKMKLKYAAAFTDNADIDDNLRLPIDPTRDIESRKFIEIVEGRMEEIILNAWHQVPSKYYDKLLGGLIITGGGANMNAIEKAFTVHTHVEKLRVAKFVQADIKATNAEIKAKNGTLNTILGLLIKGDMNCAGVEVSDDLFKEPSATTHNEEPETPAKPRPITEFKGGVVPKEEDQKAIEDERKRKEEEAEQKRLEEERIAEEERKEEERRKKEEARKNSPMNKFMRNAKKVIQDIFTGED